MDILSKYRSRLCCLLAVIVAVACCGKALHTHSESYWLSLAQTETAAENGSSIVDDCPVCHYNICFFTDGVPLDFRIYITQLDCRYFAVTCECIAEQFVLPSLRGSPSISPADRMA